GQQRLVDVVALLFVLLMFLLEVQATSGIYTLSLHDALPICGGAVAAVGPGTGGCAPGAAREPAAAGTDPSRARAAPRGDGAAPVPGPRPGRPAREHRTADLGIRERAPGARLPGRRAGEHHRIHHATAPAHPGPAERAERHSEPADPLDLQAGSHARGAGAPVGRELRGPAEPLQVPPPDQQLRPQA